MLEKDAAKLLMSERFQPTITIIEPKGKGEGLKCRYSVMNASPDNLDGLDRSMRCLTKEDADFSEEQAAIIDALVGLGMQWGDEDGKHALIGADGSAMGHDRGSLRGVSQVILSATLNAILEHANRPNAESQPS